MKLFRRDMACAELVEVITDYLEGKLPAGDRRRFERHLRACDGCDAYLDQMRTTISLSTYNSYIRNGRTGAKALNLPLITVGGTNPDLIKRPVANEDVDKPILYGERMYTKSSLRTKCCSSYGTQVWT